MYEFDVKEFAYNYLISIGEDLDTIEESIDLDDEHFQYNGIEYRFMDEYSFKCYTDGLIENYIDECVLPEIPEIYHSYFDENKFKGDIEDINAFVSSYDGNVDEFYYENKFYYIWRE